MTNLFDYTQLQPAPKQTPVSPLIGLKVRLDWPVDRERPCCRNICIIAAGNGLSAQLAALVSRRRMLRCQPLGSPQV